MPGIGSSVSNIFKSAPKEVFNASKDLVVNQAGVKFELPGNAKPEAKKDEKKPHPIGNFNQTELSGFQAFRMQKRIQQIAIETNTLIGMSNVEYQGIIDLHTGELNAYTKNLVEAKKSENTKQQQKQISRQQMVAAATGKAGPGVTFSLDKAHNANNVQKLTG